MQLGCPRCHDRQTVPASLLSTGEARVRCAGCGAWFQVRVRSAAVPPPPPSDAAPSGRWYIRRRDETVLQFPSIRALYDYVVQGVVTIEDEISRGGKRWRPLRDVPELHGLFDRAEVEVLPAQRMQDTAQPRPTVDGDGELEPILVAEVVTEPALARHAAPPPVVRVAPSPEVVRPRAPPPSRATEPARWQQKGIEDLGAADGSDVDEDGAVVVPRRSAWGPTVVLLLVGICAWAVWHFAYRDSGDPIRVRFGEVLPPSQRAGGPERPPARTGEGAHVQAAVPDPDEAPVVTLRTLEEAVQQGRGPAEPSPVAGPPVARLPEPSSVVAPSPARPPEPVELGFDAHMRRGNDLLASNPTAAIAHFQKAMALSGSVEPVAKIGWAYLNQGRPQEAIIWFERALTRSNRYASTYEGLGRALERAGRRSEAIRAYEQYLENFPVGSQASRVRGALERLRGAP